MPKKINDQRKTLGELRKKERKKKGCKTVKQFEPWTNHTKMKSRGAEMAEGGKKGSKGKHELEE